MGPESPVKLWLIKNSYSHDTNTALDMNGDSVSLLMAYALNLDPRSNLSSSMPLPQLDEALLSITYYAASEGITYQVQTTDNLSSWTTSGVSISQPDTAGFRTASVPATDTARFIRLVVSE
jgi:hypothetical protein